MRRKHSSRSTGPRIRKGDKMADFDILGDAPDRPKVYGLAIRQCAKSSFEFEMLARSMESMATARAEFGRDDNPEFIESDDDADTDDLGLHPDAPDELADIEN